MTGYPVAAMKIHAPMILRLALALLVSAVSVTAQEATEATEAASQVESSATDETTLLLESVV